MFLEPVTNELKDYNDSLAAAYSALDAIAASLEDGADAPSDSVWTALQTTIDDAEKIAKNIAAQTEKQIQIFPAYAYPNSDDLKGQGQQAIKRFKEYADYIKSNTMGWNDVENLLDLFRKFLNARFAGIADAIVGTGNYTALQAECDRLKSVIKAMHSTKQSGVDVLTEARSGAVTMADIAQALSVILDGVEAIKKAVVR